MEEKKNKKLKVLIIVGIVLVLVSGVTLAYFMSRRTGTPTSVEAKDLAITYTGESKFNINSAIDPIMEDEILTSAPKVEFTVTNNGEDNVYLQFDIVDIAMTKFKDYDFKWALYQGETKITTGSFIAEEDGEVTLAAGKELVPSTPTVYSVYVWIDETMKDQNELMGGSFTGTVQVTGYGKDNTLAGKILLETINSNPTFSATSTDRGLFIQSGDSEKSNFGFPTYYYKGSTTNTSINSTYSINNYVSFGTYKTNGGNNTVGQPIIWRIVRINEDSSIRLISQRHIGSYTSYATTSTGTSDYSGSNLESVINTWYESNIGSSSGTTLDNLVQTGNFCNDISGNYNAVKTRIDNTNPIFICPNDGVMINSKAGAITADELMYAGSMYGDVNSNNKTHLMSNDWDWTMSPKSTDYAYVFLGESDGGYMAEQSVSSDSGLNFGPRAVINLKPDVIVKSGNGSSTSPYVIG